MYSEICRNLPPDLADEVVTNEVEMIDMRKIVYAEDTAGETKSDSECNQDVDTRSEVGEVEVLAEVITVQPSLSKASIEAIQNTEHGEFPRAKDELARNGFLCCFDFVVKILLNHPHFCLRPWPAAGLQVALYHHLRMVQSSKIEDIWTH